MLLIPITGREAISDVNKDQSYKHVSVGNGFKIKAIIVFVCMISFITQSSAQNKKSASGGVKKNLQGNTVGYRIAQTEKVDLSFNAGFSIYTAAWPLPKEYRGSCVLSRLFGIWMFPLRLIVTRPVGLEVGYVPVVTRQEVEK
jgi:hypothetical protein